MAPKKSKSAAGTTTSTTNKAEVSTTTAPVTVDHPEPNDVLCGRGKNSFRHRGNYYFRHLIVQYASSYKMAGTKKQKGEVVMLVARAVVARGGRFLVRMKGDDNGKAWRDGGLQQGQKKAGHAFRDAVRGRVKCLQSQYSSTRNTVAGGLNSSSSSVPTKQASSLPPMYSTVEPSNDWMTASMDPDLAKYVRNLFLLSQNTTNFEAL